MLDSSVFDKAVELIGRARSILVTTHTKPDGDACGSAAALAEALEGRGKKVEVLMLSEVPAWYEFLFDKKPVVFERDINAEQLSSKTDADLIILVDVNSENQLQGFGEWLRANRKKVLVFDHHVTSDGLGDAEVVDVEASSAGLVVFEFLKYAGWAISGKMAEALFLAIATDTGWFRFANVDGRTHRACAELLDMGVDSAGLYKQLYQNFSAERFALMNLMLGRLVLHFEGRYACQEIYWADFAKTGASPVDTENLIDECQRIKTVEAAALFTELSDGRIKCSMRSRGAVDVREIAAKFGGGGHVMAAGTYVPGPMDNAKKLIYAEMEGQIRG